MILSTEINANYELVRRRRQAAMGQNNTRENKRRIAFPNKKGDNVLILERHLDPKLKLHEGPCDVLH
jgi:hypothetical protein